MIVCGLTGGIGAGKSTVADVFKRLGVPVFSADDEAKQIIATHQDLQDQLLIWYGEEVISDGRVNRQYLANILFKDSVALERINSLVHPLVRNTFVKWCTEHTQADYVIQEAAILFETGHYKNFDKNILVVADEESRIQRVILRPGMDRASIRERIDKQWKDELKIPLADFIIDNNENQIVVPQILNIHQQLVNQTHG